MKIISKNYKLSNGVRSYLVYLIDENDQPIECVDVSGEDQRIKIENEFSEKYGIDTDNVKYVTLDKFKMDQDIPMSPILVFYLNRDLFTVDRSLLNGYTTQINDYLNGDVKLFFFPTDGDERVECINPVLIKEDDEYRKLINMIEDVKTKFSIID